MMPNIMINPDIMVPGDWAMLEMETLYHANHQSDNLSLRPSHTLHIFTNFQNLHIMNPKVVLSNIREGECSDPRARQCFVLVGNSGTGHPIAPVEITPLAPVLAPEDTGAQPTDPPTAPASPAMQPPTTPSTSPPKHSCRQQWRGWEDSWPGPHTHQASNPSLSPPQPAQEPPRPSSRQHRRT